MVNDSFSQHRSMQGNPDPEIRKIFAHGIRNPEIFPIGIRNPSLWNREYSSTNPGPTNGWKPESKFH